MSTKIEWTDETWNPVTGCDKVSRGCAHCYAERVTKRFTNHYPKGFAVDLRPERLDQPLRWTRPRTIFVNSMSDLFHEDVHRDFVLRVFLTMARCPQHTFQILTKRPKRMRDLISEWLEPAMTLASGAALRRPEWPLPNVMLGVSVEDQRTAEERIPILLETPAAVRFLSCEPLLGPVALRDEWIEAGRQSHFSVSVSGALRNRAFVGICDDDGRELHPEHAEHRLRELEDKGVRLLKASDCDNFDDERGCLGHDVPRIDWVIAGGESGPKARPTHPDAVRAIRDQCKGARVPFFFKQWGEWRPALIDDRFNTASNTKTLARLVDIEGNVHCTREAAGEDAVAMIRVGKLKAGRELDGQIHDAMPLRCGHSECSQHYIETGEAACVRATATNKVME